MSDLPMSDLLFAAVNVDAEYKKPVRGTCGSIGYDLFCSEECSVSGQGGVVQVRTNTSVRLPPGCGGLILGKSGLGSRGLVVLGGVIDNDYTGELVVILGVIGDEAFHFKVGQKVAQLVIVPCCTDGLGGAMRGSDGFGSTGAF